MYKMNTRSIIPIVTIDHLQMIDWNQGSLADEVLDRVQLSGRFLEEMMPDGVHQSSVVVLEGGETDERIQEAEDLMMMLDGGSISKMNPQRWMANLQE